MKSINWWVVLAGATLAGVLVLAVVFIVRVTAPPAIPEPPLAYTQSEYAAERLVYLPGEQLVYTPTLRVARPGKVTVLRDFWNRDTNASAYLCNGEIAPSIGSTRNLPASTKDTDRGSAVRVRVPDLQPGRYWIQVTATKDDGAESAYQVDFVVARPCPDDR